MSEQSREIIDNFRNILKIFGKICTLGKFWKTNFELLTGNLEEMLEIW